jgi:hypothetical protein
MDNATVNAVLFQTAVRALLTLYDIPEQPDKQIHCLAHILNLVAQAILGALKEVDDCAEDGDESDHFLLHKDSPIHYNVADNVELNELEANKKSDLSVDDEIGVDGFEKKMEEEEAKEMSGSTALQRVM